MSRTLWFNDAAKLLWRFQQLSAGSHTTKFHAIEMIQVWGQSAAIPIILTSMTESDISQAHGLDTILLQVKHAVLLNMAQNTWWKRYKTPFLLLRLDFQRTLTRLSRPMPIKGSIWKSRKQKPIEHCVEKDLDNGNFVLCTRNISKILAALVDKAAQILQVLNTALSSFQWLEWNKKKMPKMFKLRLFANIRLACRGRWGSK